MARHLYMLSLVLSVMGLAATASAETINIGYDGTNIVTCRIVTGADNDVRGTINAGSALTANFTYTGTVNADVVVVHRGTDLACDTAPSDLLTGITFSTFKITLNGTDGNDRLSGGNGTTDLNGGGGDDRIRLYFGGVAQGGAGADDVTSNFATGGESLYGDDDNDCLEQVDESVAPSVFDCGAGTDSFDNSLATEVSCEGGGTATCQAP